jgi:hypothetical protein
MNYVITFTDHNCIENILKVWLPTLKQNFNGIPVVITFHVKQNDIYHLKAKGAKVIQANANVEGLYNTVANRLQAQEEFIRTLSPEDKALIIDGGDVVFQSEINSFFKTINHNKIIYSDIKEKSNSWTICSFKKFLEFHPDIYNQLLARLKSTNLKSVGLLAGNRNVLIQYFELHKRTLQKFTPEIFFGVNQMILTYLVLKYPEKFITTDIHTHRPCDDNNPKTTLSSAPILHFSRPKMKEIYKDLYL